MLALQRISNWISTTESDTLPPPHPTSQPGVLGPPYSPRSRFESLPTELRLQIYTLLLSGKPRCCHFEKGKIGCSYSILGFHPAILAVNRSISAEACPILYGENTVLFLGITKDARDLDVQHQSLSRLAGLPKFQKQMPERSLDPIKIDWVGPLLELLPAIKTVEFDFWLRTCQTPHVLEPFTSIPTLNASIPAIKSLVTASTQIFHIGTRDIAAYHDIGCRFSRRKPVDLPGLQLALLDLRGLDNVQEKSRMVHKALRFIIEILGQRPPMPKDTIPPGQALVSVGKSLLVHRDFAGFWFSDALTVPSENQGWRPVGSNRQIVKIGQRV